jgi:DNA modification methylase
VTPQSRAVLLNAFRDGRPLTGASAGLYRYPARFSPSFVKSAIETFTDQNDVVLDPFVGGGTSIVEALALGRRAVALDVNPLACLISAVRTTPLAERQGDALRSWAAHLRVDARRRLPADERVTGLPPWVAAFLVPALESAAALPGVLTKRAASTVLLRLGQWLLEVRSVEDHVNRDLWLDQAETFTDNLLGSLDDLKVRAASNGVRPRELTARRKIFLASAEDLRSTYGLTAWGAARLMLTSPPYPGVHVLYHRWQVRSRREVAAPFWLADLRDGAGPSHYTLGGRHAKGLQTYFTKLSSALTAAHDVLERNAPLVQVVAFVDSASQLPKFQAVVKRSGFTVSTNFPRAHFRLVPGRRWYAPRQGGDGGREYLLIHHAS